MKKLVPSARVRNFHHFGIFAFTKFLCLACFGLSFDLQQGMEVLGMVPTQDTLAGLLQASWSWNGEVLQGGTYLLNKRDIYSSAILNLRAGIYRL